MAKEKTQFKPGNGGRPKGAKNKSLTRSKIAEILNDAATWTKFSTELKKLKGRHYCETLIKLWEFDTPKFSSINFSLSNMSEQDLEFLVNHIKQQMSNENELD